MDTKFDDQKVIKTYDQLLIKINHSAKYTLRKECLYSEFFCSAFSDWIRRDTPCFRIQFECGKIRTRITPNMNTFYSVSPHIQSECRKIQTKITPNTDTFLRSDKIFQAFSSCLRNICKNFTFIEIFLTRK